MEEKFSILRKQVKLKKEAVITLKRTREQRHVTLSPLLPPHSPSPDQPTTWAVQLPPRYQQSRLKHDRLQQHQTLPYGEAGPSPPRLCEFPGREFPIRAAGVKAAQSRTSLLVKKTKRNDLLVIFFKENTSVRLGKTNFPPQQLNQLLVFDLEQEV